MTEKKFENLPTGKPHISFSELSDWYDCTWRHKLKQIDKIDLSSPGIALDNGTGIHASCEDFLKTREMKVDIAQKIILDALKSQYKSGNFNNYVRFDPDNEIEYNKLFKKYKKAGGRFTKKNQVIFDSFKNEYVNGAESTLIDVPAFMDREFPEWEYVDAEHKLYEKVGIHPHAFKGYIDGIIKCKNRRGKTVYWLIDWKTTAWGWHRLKKQDKKTHLQLVYYKTFWSKKMGIDLRDIRCGFVLLKRDAKPGQHCELLSISVGELTKERSLKVINNMFASMNRKMFLKNKTNCKWCEFKNTEHCTGTACVD